VEEELGDQLSFVAIGTFYKVQLELSRTYGPLCRIPIVDEAKKKVIFALQVADAGEAKRLLNVNPPKSFTYRNIDPLAGFGVLTNRNHQEWADQRKEVTPGFSWDVLRHNFGFVRDSVHDLRDKIKKLAEAGTPFDIHQQFTDLTFLVMQCLLVSGDCFFELRLGNPPHNFSCILQLGDKEFPDVSGKELRRTFDLIQQQWWDFGDLCWHYLHSSPNCV